MKKFIKKITSFFTVNTPKNEDQYLDSFLEMDKNISEQFNNKELENQELRQQLKIAQAECQQLRQQLRAAEYGSLNYTLGVLNNTVNVLAATRVVEYDGMGNPRIEPVIENEITRILGANIIEDCLVKIKKLV